MTGSAEGLKGIEKERWDNRELRTEAFENLESCNFEDCDWEKI